MPGRSIFGAAIGLLIAHAPAQAADLRATPLELREAFARYTEHMGIDPDSCVFGIWDSDIARLTPKAMMANAFARCTMGRPYKVCTRLAGQLTGQAPVENGCITGFDSLSFLPVVALSARGGFFVVVHHAKDRPLRLAQQLTLGLEPDRNFCELSAHLIDADANRVAGGSYHAIGDVLADAKLCRKQKPGE